MEGTQRGGNQVKAKLSPQRFQNIISSAMISTEIDPIRLKVGEKGIIAMNASASGHLFSIVLAHVSPEKTDDDYFISYKGKKTQEELIFGKEVLDRLSWGFKKDELTITTEENTMLIEDGTDKLPVELDASMEHDKTVPISKTKYGLLPDFSLYAIIKDEKPKPEKWTEKNTLKGYRIFKVNKENLEFPGKVTNYRINLEEGKLSISIGGTSTSFIHNIEGELLTGKDISIILDCEAFKSIVNNLEGEIYLFFNDLCMIFLETAHPQLNKSFTLATKEE